MTKDEIDAKISADAADETFIAACVAKFDGTIKYDSMHKDFPSWSVDDCVQFAQVWHDNAVFQYKAKVAQVTVDADAAKAALVKSAELDAEYGPANVVPVVAEEAPPPDDPLNGWNNGISYCLNVIIDAVKAEAS